MTKSKSKLLKISNKFFVGYKVSSKDIRNIKEVINALDDEKEEILNEFIEDIKSYSKSKMTDYNKLNKLNKDFIAKKLDYSISSVYHKLKTKTFTEEEIAIILDDV